MKYCILILFLALPLTPSWAVPAAPEGGVAIVEASKLAPAKLEVRLANGDYGTKKIVPVTGQAFKQALEINITRRPPNTWDAGARAGTTGAIKKGDALLFGFWARGRATGKAGGGVAEFVFERQGNPYTKSIQYLAETPVDGSWAHFWVSCRSLEDYEPGGAQMNFQLGYQEESISIAGIEAWNYGQRDLDQLPSTPLTYVGRKADAAWRKDALKRIDQHRRGDLTITLVDANGQPQAGQKVRAKLDRLAFDIGTAVKAKMLVEDKPGHEAYRQAFKNHFNLGVIENALKWKQWDQWPSNRKYPLEALRWMKKENIPARGHVMVWPGDRYLPEAIKALKNDPRALRTAIDQHIIEMAKVTDGYVRDWDVLNEVFANRDLTNVLGDPAMVHWFKTARKAAPGVKLYYNDYAALVRGGFPTGHKEHFEQTLRYLVENDAPIDGVGIQGHFGSLLTPPHRLYAELDRWAAIGLDILITEFDVTVPGERLRADYTRDFLTLCFSHPAVDGIVAWGFWEGAQWRPESAIWAKDWTLTPMGEEWIRLTTRVWNTDESLTTDAKGQVHLRGFLGQYTASANQVTESFNHDSDGTAVTLRIP